MLAEAKARAPEIVATGEKFKAETIEQAKVEAKAEADRIIAAAKAEIEQEVARAKEQLRNQVADLAVAGAAKILQREVDAKAHADLLAAIKQRALSRAPWPNSPPSPVPTPKPRSRSRASRTRCRCGREMLRLASDVVADPRMAAALDNPKLDAPAKESLLLSIAGDELNARRPQLRARAGRGRPHRAAAADRRRCSTR